MHAGRHSPKGGPVCNGAALRATQGETDQARQNFERAAELRSNGRANVAGRLALAALLFGQGRHAAALAHYQRALREHPGGPPEIRLGIAACLFRRGALACRALGLFFFRLCNVVKCSATSNDRLEGYQGSRCKHQ